MSPEPAPPLPSLPVLRTLGGCGGTLVARVIAAIPGTLLLSETNPRSVQLYGGMLNPIEQLKKWHPDLVASVAEFDPGEIGYPPRFGVLMQRIRRAAALQNRTLVVRDFNYVDFVGVPFVWPVPNDLSLDAAVAGSFEPQAAVIVRHPADQLASLRSHAAIAPVLDAARFVEAYHAFLHATRDVPRFTYENLVAAPADWFAALCSRLGLRWNPSALTGFASVESVTGNLRQAHETAIGNHARSAAGERAERELSEVAAYQSLLAKLGYSSPVLSPPNE